MMRTGAFTLGQFGLWKAFDQVSIRGSAELELGLRQGFELEGNLQYSRASAKLGLGLGVGHWHVLGLGGILEAAFDLASALPSGRAQTIQEGKHRIDALARGSSRTLHNHVAKYTRHRENCEGSDRQSNHPTLLNDSSRSAS